jgi:hypothetical protein
MSNRPLTPTERDNLRADVAAAKRRKALAERSAARVATLTADGDEAAAMRVALSYTSQSLANCLRGRKRIAVAERIAADRGVTPAVALRAMIIAYRVPRWAIANALPRVAAGATLPAALAEVARERREACEAIEACFGEGFRDLLAQLAELTR